MKWVERINLRAGSHNSQAILLQVMEMTSQIHGAAGLTEANVYSHAVLDGDFEISLLWDTDELYHHGSPTGLGLAQTLKKFGLIDHSTWIKRD